ncbi:hypothetical protein C8R43DRAFT_1140349 [Mycena crocata]|nr:hypothetical protein C8R43DRAFT_1140349 [Mycena crocata]
MAARPASPASSQSSVLSEIDDTRDTFLDTLRSARAAHAKASEILLTRKRFWTTAAASGRLLRQAIKARDTELWDLRAAVDKTRLALKEAEDAAFINGITEEDAVDSTAGEDEAGAGPTEARAASVVAPDHCGPVVATEESVVVADTTVATDTGAAPEVVSTSTPERDAAGSANLFGNLGRPDSTRFGLLGQHAAKSSARWEPPARLFTGRSSWPGHLVYSRAQIEASDVTMADAVKEGSEDTDMIDRQSEDGPFQDLDGGGYVDLDSPLDEAGSQPPEHNMLATPPLGPIAGVGGEVPRDLPMGNALVTTAVGVLQAVVDSGNPADCSTPTLVRWRASSRPDSAGSGMEGAVADDVKMEPAQATTSSADMPSPLLPGSVPLSVAMKLEDGTLLKIAQATTLEGFTSTIPSPAALPPPPPADGKRKNRKSKGNKASAPAPARLTGPKEEVPPQAEPPKTGGHTVKNWKAMGEAQRTGQQAKGSTALAELVAAQKRKQGKCGRMRDHRGLASYMRDIQEFCPEAGHLSIQIFQEIHRTSGANNYVCGYHHLLGGPKSKLVDGDPNLPYKINGHPAPYQLAPMGRAVVDDDEQDDNPGAVDNSDQIVEIFSCGCESEETAIEYHAWKQNPQLVKSVYGSAFRADDGSLQRADPGFMKDITEGLGSERLPPRHRAFLVAMLKRSGVTLDVIYQDGLTMPEYNFRLVKARMQCLIDEYHLAALGCGRVDEFGSVRLLMLNEKETDEEDLKEIKEVEGVTFSLLPTIMPLATWWMGERSPDTYYQLFGDLENNDGARREARNETIEDRRAYMFGLLGARYVSTMLAPSRAQRRASELPGVMIVEEVDPQVMEERREMFYVMNIPSQEPTQRWIKGGWLSEAEATSALLREEVENLRARLITAQIDSFLADEILRDHRAIVAPIKSLPEEILSMILLDAIRDRSKEAEAMWRFQRLFIVMKVCRAWRNCVQDNPNFWTDIVFPTSGWGNSDGWTHYVKNRRTDEEIWWRSGAASVDALWLAGLATRLERARGLPLDVTLAANRTLPAGMIEAVVNESNRWGSLEITSVEHLAEAVENQWPAHSWVPVLAGIRNRASKLRTLTLEGADFRGSWRVMPENALWRGSTVEPRDKITWFENAPLTEVDLRGLFRPEETLIINWGGLTRYKESRTRRTGRLPLDHLRRLSNVKEMVWRNCWLTGEERDSATLPALTSMQWMLERQPNNISPHSLEPYDRLRPLVLPSLVDLDLEGTGFDIAPVGPDVVTSITALLQRSRCALVSLKLDLTTGISSAGAILLLTQIPTLKTFWVREHRTDDGGIMTEDFLRSLTDVAVTVNFLKIEGARGVPADAPNFRMLHDFAWLNALVDMLEYQFARNLKTMDFLRHPGSDSPWVCPFGKLSHMVIEERLQQQFAEGKRLLVHERGEECPHKDEKEDFDSPASEEEDTDDPEDEDEEDDDEDEEDSDAYENGVSVSGASDVSQQL